MLEGLTADSLTVEKAITSFGQIEELRYVLKGGADAQWRTSDGDSAIENACSRGHLSTVEILLHQDKYLLEIEGSCEIRDYTFTNCDRSSLCGLIWSNKNESICI